MNDVTIPSSVGMLLLALPSSIKKEYAFQVLAYLYKWDNVEILPEFKASIGVMLDEAIARQENLRRVRAENGKKGGRPRKTPETATPPIPQSPSPIVDPVPVTPPPQKAGQGKDRKIWQKLTTILNYESHKNNR